MTALAVVPGLAAPEQRRLRELEAVVERGLKTFVEVGLALTEIRDGRLYRETHPTFESYCEGRWQFSGRRARQLIAAAEIGTMVPVANERQARELTPLHGRPEQLRDVWDAVTEFHSEPTAADIRAEVARRAETTRSLGLSETFEWYTPAEYIDAARVVLGEIDLDPASCVEANATVQAKVFYTAADDGLTQPWRGRVWLNPPYCRQAAVFVEKLVSEFNSGRVTEAVLLVNAYSTETRWMQALLATRTVCFAAKRINFHSPVARGNGSPHGSAFVYFGRNPGRFAREFARFGVIVEARTGVEALW